MNRIHIHNPQPTRIEANVRDCPQCKRRRVFVETYTPWYGWYATCLGCGDQWNDGEWMPRRFRPGWRRDRIERARKHYRTLRPILQRREAGRRWLLAESAVGRQPPPGRRHWAL